MHIFKCACKFSNACICMHVHACACICMHMHAYAFICMRMHACACKCMHSSVPATFYSELKYAKNIYLKKLHARACTCMQMHAFRKLHALGNVHANLTVQPFGNVDGWNLSHFSFKDICFDWRSTLFWHDKRRLADACSVLCSLLLLE